MKIPPLQSVPINRQTFGRFRNWVGSFTRSESGWKAQALFFGVIALMGVINVLNVINSYVGRDFMTAIEQRDSQEFVAQAFVWAGVFALLTIAAVVYRYFEETLGLMWREWMTASLLRRYLDNRTYYRLDTRGRLPNPDQRISEDVRAFTVTTLSFVLMLLNGSITVVLFSQVLWSISPLLFLVALVYAGVGSYLTVVLGRSLIRLNYDQSDREADFRADLVHVRENAESVALLHREGWMRMRLLRHLRALTDNFHRIITINRNLGFFTTGYNWMIQLIPALIVAPMFIAGTVEFGVITQAAIAFTHLLGAFSLIVTQFQSISSFTAVIARLSDIEEAIEAAEAVVSRIEVCENCEHIGYEHLTLRSPTVGRILVNDLTITIPRGTRLLIRGPSERAKVALLRATAGIWETGEGRIVCPGFEQLLFLPERPYVPPGTLRDVLLRTWPTNTDVPDERVREVLQLLGAERIVTRAGGLTTEQDWDDILSLSEQQLLAFARLLLATPAFAFLDRPNTALSVEQVDRVLGLLTQHGIGYITLSDTEDKLQNFDAVLDIAEDGSWQWHRVQDGQVVEGESPADPTSISAMTQE